jgi:hypothetical protein
MAHVIDGPNLCVLCGQDIGAIVKDLHAENAEVLAWARRVHRILAELIDRGVLSDDVNLIGGAPSVLTGQSVEADDDSWKQTWIEDEGQPVNGDVDIEV